MKNHQAVILVAGGTGERSGQKIPKQFVEILNKPIILHSAEKFFYYNSQIVVVVVCHNTYTEKCQNLFRQYLPDAENIYYTNGGETRFHSVKNGLEFLRQINFEGVVAVHDAARPCVSVSLIKRCFEIAAQKRNAIPSVPLNESIRQIKDDNNTMVFRENYRIVQTPQCANFSTLYNAFQQPYQPVFTDDANVLETFGEIIHLIDGETTNIKITYPMDFIIAENILSSQQKISL
ncbi:MAG: 2-C-methyl-D-erythritol 4-phosphate cytidylyltransferase [Bacteroidia bacterium]